MPHKREKLVYKVGGIAAFCAELLFRRNFSAEMHMFQGFGIFSVPDPLPESASGWLTFLADHLFAALSLLEAGEIVNYIIVCLVYFAFYLLMKKHFPRLSALALALTLIAAGTNAFANKSLALWSLNRQYTAADPAQTSALVGQAETLLSAHQHGFGIQAGLFLILLSGLLFAILGLRSNQVKISTAWFGILFNGFALLNFAVMPLVPSLAWVLPTLFAPFRLLWHVMLGIKFLKM